MQDSTIPIQIDNDLKKATPSSTANGNKKGTVVLAFVGFSCLIVTAVAVGISFPVALSLREEACTLVGRGRPYRISGGDIECQRGRSSTKWEMTVEVHVAAWTLDANASVFETCLEDFSKWNVSSGTQFACLYAAAEGGALPYKAIRISYDSLGREPGAVFPTVPVITLIVLLVITLPTFVASVYLTRRQASKPPALCGSTVIFMVLFRVGLFLSIFFTAFPWFVWMSEYEWAM